MGVLQIVTELLVGRNHGLALLLFDRGVETVIGAAVAVTIVVLSERLRHRTHDAR